MLVRGLVIIIEATNAGLLLILDNLLSQNLKLKLHKVDLLLQVDDVVVGCIDVRVISELAGSLLLLLLSSEIHCDGRLITCAVAEAASTEGSPAFERAASYIFQIQIKHETSERWYFYIDNLLAPPAVLPNDCIV